MGKIEKLLQLSDELEFLIKETSDLIIKAKENKDQDIEIIREEKQIKIKEKDLWDEVYYQAKTNAVEILKGLYPEVFEKEKEQIAKRNELVEYCVKEMKIKNPFQMNIGDLTRLIIEVKNA